MSYDVIKRKELEELMFSLSFKITTDNDIKRINDIYAMNQSEQTIFHLENSKKYFEQIIVPYCFQEFIAISNTIQNEEIKEQFNINFKKQTIDIDIQRSPNINEISNDNEEPLININNTIQQKRDSKCKKVCKSNRCLIILIILLAITCGVLFLVIYYLSESIAS